MTSFDISQFVYICIVIHIFIDIHMSKYLTLNDAVMTNSDDELQNELLKDTDKQKVMEAKEREQAPQEAEE